MNIQCGTDIIEIDRIRKALEKSSTSFSVKVFTESEINYCESKKNAKFKSYAARFAAKEAVAKALGTGIDEGIRWKDIEVLNDMRGKPHINLYGKARDIYEALGGSEISLSLSHCENYAVAFAVIKTGI